MKIRIWQLGQNSVAIKDEEKKHLFDDLKKKVKKCTDDDHIDIVWEYPIPLEVTTVDYNTQHNKLLLWRLGSLEHKIIAQPDAFKRLHDMIESLDLDLPSMIWGPDIECITI